MIESKKAIESYIIIILGVSFLLSILLFFTIQYVYQRDDKLCQDIAFTYEVVCKQESGYTVSVENTGSYPISFEMNGEVRDEYYVETGKKERFNVLSKSSTAIGIPIVFDSNGSSHFCRSQQERSNVEVLTTC